MEWVKIVKNYNKYKNILLSYKVIYKLNVEILAEKTKILHDKLESKNLAIK